MEEPKIIYRDVSQDAKAEIKANHAGLFVACVGKITVSRT